MRNNVSNLGVPPKVLCGQLISVEKSAIGVRMSRDAGGNVAILGSGEGNRTSADALPFNYAVVLVENMAISLALQHPNGDARFFLLNGLEKTFPSTMAYSNGSG